jgi:heme A synthase
MDPVEPETGPKHDSTARIALAALAATLLLIVVGGFTRGSGSGYGCADRWPLCEEGLLGGWLPS